MIHDSETEHRHATRGDGPASATRGSRTCWRPTRPRYFEEAAGLWDRLTAETARFLIVGLFPNWSSAIDEQTLRLADEFLADTSRPAALQRLISEGRAEVARAVRARAVDTAAG